MELAELESKSVEELQDIAKGLDIPDYNRLRKQELTLKIMQSNSDEDGLIFGRGVLEILADGWGFLRHDNFSPAQDDIYVSQTQIKKFNLKTGDWVSGKVRPPKASEKYYGLLRVEAVNDLDPDQARQRRDFDELTPSYPDQRLVMETTPQGIPARFIDLIAPIGKGQRGVIQSPPKAGKTTLLKTIANSIAVNHPEVFLTNASFALVAYVAERRTGRSWESLMEEQVFQPLGLKTAGFGRPRKECACACAAASCRRSMGRSWRRRK